MRLTLLILASALLRVEAASAQNEPNFTPSVRVHGEATLSVEPDRAEIDIGVVAQGATSQAASESNSKQAKTVIDRLKAAAPGATIKTVNFSVNPNYRYSKEGGAATILGYSANNTVRMELDDTALLRGVIEAATKAGANNVNRLNFTLKDENPYRAQALERAAAQGRASAEALAKSLRLHLGRVLLVEEGQPVTISPARQVEFTKSESDTSTPISAGNIDVHASVNITFALAP